VKTLLLRRARVIDPASDLDAVRDVLIEGGRIAKVSARSLKREGTVFELEGLVVAPGFIDLNAHLGEPGYEWKETIGSGGAAAAAGGFTAVAAMPSTDPINDCRAVTELIVATALEQSPVRIYPVGALSKRMEGAELAHIGEMVEAGAVAICDDARPVANGSLMRCGLEYSLTFDVPVLVHPKDATLAGQGVVHEGVISAELGFDGLPASAEEAMLSRDLLLAEDTKARLHVQHLSTQRGLGLIRAARKSGARVTCEVTPHHLTLEQLALRSFDTNLKVDPPLRPESDRAALVRGLRDGHVDAIASDHRPHEVDAKQVEFSRAPFGAAGLETAVRVILTRMLHEEGVPLPRLIEALSTRPASILGIEGGSLAVGAPADITVLDLEREGSVDIETFRGLSCNTPYRDWETRGAPVMTIVGGRVVEDGR
jgi:dihydroorotase